MHKKRFQHAQSCWETSRKHIFTRYCISIKYWPKLPHFKELILGFTECPSSAAATCIIAQGFIYMIKLFILQRRKTENALKSCHRISMMLYTHRTSSITYWIIEFQDRSRFALWPWPEISFIALLDFLSFLHVYTHTNWSALHGHLFGSLACIEGKVFCVIHYTVCPRILDPICIVTYYIKWVQTSWTYRTDFSIS